MSLPKGTVTKYDNQTMQYAPFLMLQSHPEDYQKFTQSGVSDATNRSRGKSRSQCRPKSQSRAQPKSHSEGKSKSHHCHLSATAHLRSGVCATKRSAAIDTIDENMLALAYFHASNIKLVQNRIIRRILQCTNNSYLIDAPNESDLTMVMESVYAELALTPGTTAAQIRKQIDHLDTTVVNRIVPHILAEVKSYSRYLSEIECGPQIMDHPINVSSRGNKILPSVTTVWQGNNY